MSISEKYKYPFPYATKGWMARKCGRSVQKVSARTGFFKDNSAQLSGIRSLDRVWQKYCIVLEFFNRRKNLIHLNLIKEKPLNTVTKS